MVAERNAHLPVAPLDELVKVAGQYPRGDAVLTQEHQPVVARVVPQLGVLGHGYPCGRVGTAVAFAVSKDGDS